MDQPRDQSKSGGNLKDLFSIVLFALLGFIGWLVEFNTLTKADREMAGIYIGEGRDL